MSIVLRHLTPDQYTVSQWSGGSTVQLAIAPDNAVYAERDFLWRLSSATVTLEESDFTALPDYERLISVLDGEMTLQHDGGAPVHLGRFEVHAFSGSSATHSIGKCTDFNLMLRRGRCKGEMAAVKADTQKHISFEKGSVLALYCVHGAGAVQINNEAIPLSPSETVLITADAAGKAELSFVPGSILMQAVITQI